MGKNGDKTKRRGRGSTARLIFNPHSGGGRNPRQRLADALKALEAHGLRVEPVTVSPAERGTAAAAEAVQCGCKLVIAMGGDGTVEAVARGLIGTKTRLGIIPAGTYNNVARSLGIPEDLNQACRILAEGSKRRMDIGEVKSKKHGKVYFFEAAVIGLESVLYPLGDALPKRKWRLALNVVRTVLRFPLPILEVSLDGKEPVKVDSLLAVVANTPNFGSVFLVAPEARLDDDLLDVALFAGFNKAEILAYLAEISGERSEGSRNVQRYQARKVKIKARPRQLVMADNQRLGKGSVTIRIRPRGLRVIAPEYAAALGEPAAETRPTRRRKVVEPQPVPNL
jgi:diacylglycerol kinase (ATP)